MKQKKIIRCPYCGRPAVLRSASDVYKDTKRIGYVYTCSNYPACDAYVGTHPGTKIPLGTLANAELRKKRIQAHQTFDLLWKYQIFSRDDAYRWLAEKMGLPLQEAHIGHFSEFYCDQVVSVCKQVLQNNLRQHVAFGG
ncbi:MAG: zinc-finger-containing protein [Hespellia sp.]|nr:zinc-finger-containing protein [Hespellia sp.]